MKLFISCDEAKLICDKTQYNEATFWEKLQLNIRLLHCGVCRKYTKRNTKLTKSIKKANLESLNLSDKEHIKEKLRQQLGQ